MVNNKTNEDKMINLEQAIETFATSTNTIKEIVAECVKTLSVHYNMTQEQFLVSVCVCDNSSNALRDLYNKTYFLLRESV